MKRFLLLIPLFLFLASCDAPPPPQKHTDLSVRTNSDGSSDFTFTMRSDAKTPNEAIEHAIVALRDRLQPEAPFAAPAQPTTK